MLAYGFAALAADGAKNYGDAQCEFIVGLIQRNAFPLTMVEHHGISPAVEMKHNRERRLHAAIPTVFVAVHRVVQPRLLFPLSYCWVQIALFMFVGLTARRCYVPLVLRPVDGNPPDKSGPCGGICEVHAATLLVSLAGRLLQLPEARWGRYLTLTLAMGRYALGLFCQS